MLCYQLTCCSNTINKKQFLYDTGSGIWSMIRDLKLKRIIWRWIWGDKSKIIIPKIACTYLFFFFLYMNCMHISKGIKSILHTQKCASREAVKKIKSCKLLLLLYSLTIQQLLHFKNSILQKHRHPSPV